MLPFAMRLSLHWDYTLRALCRVVHIFLRGVDVFDAFVGSGECFLAVSNVQFGVHSRA